MAYFQVFYDFIFTNGSAKMGNCFSRGKILQMINICETHGIYVPQETNYMVTDKPYCLTYSVEFTCVLICLAAL